MLSERSWLGSDPKHHVNMMTARELTALLEKHGLRVESVGQLSAKFTYVFLWSGLLGRVLPTAYDFDTVLDSLRFPLRSLRARPLRTLHAYAAVAYMLPVIVPMAAIGPLAGRGEVLRIVARKVG